MRNQKLRRLRDRQNADVRCVKCGAGRFTITHEIWRATLGHRFLGERP